MRKLDISPEWSRAAAEREGNCEVGAGALAMDKVVVRKLTEREQAVRLAHKVLDRVSADPDDDLAMLARQLLRADEHRTGRPMDAAPRDGTHFLAYLYHAPDDYDYPGFGEWREIWYEPSPDPIFGGQMTWAAGDSHDSHDGGAPDHFGPDVPIAWVPLPDRPRTS